MDKKRINLYDVLLCLSNAIDLVTPELSNHHEQVAYLAYRLAEQMDLLKEEQRDVIIAGLLHDIGALSINENLLLIENDSINSKKHAFRGAKLLEESPIFMAYSKTVRYHHISWDFGGGTKFMGETVPLSSHLVHLADRVCLLIKSNCDILTQVPDIITKVKLEEDSDYMPKMVDALVKLSEKEHIWLELIYKAPLECIPDMSVFGIIDLDLDDIICISKMFSRVIDFRSHSTATHSAGVAQIAKKLGEAAGFSPNECKMLLIAGYFHDLGKLAIEESVLQKPSNLSEKEFNTIRSHTFYTYQLLNKIEGFETINKWASYHHEKLNGNGYPFHLNYENIPLGSRIMAVADIFTAITEDRTYRKGMDKENIISVLESMVEDGSICKKVVALVLENFEILTKICEESQQEAKEDFESFFAEEDNK